MKRLSKINETYWSRMNRRAQGTLDRKEDRINVDDLNVVEFHKYLLDNYMVTYTCHGLNDIKDNPNEYILEIPILKYHNDKRYCYRLIYKYQKSKKDVHMSNMALNISYPYLLDVLKKEFNVEITTGFVFISPRDGSECTNSFCIKVIKTILKNAKEEDLLLAYK